MITLRTILRSAKTAWQSSCSLRHAMVVTLIVVVGGVTLLSVGSCERRPELYLRKIVPTRFTITNLALKLDTYWDYSFIYGVKYDWRGEWYYGWDKQDSTIFGPIGYTDPEVFNLRRYYTSMTPYAPHNRVQSHIVNGHEFTGDFEFGFWDLLVWNDIHTPDNVQSLILDETSSLDSVTASTNPSMRTSRYSAPRFTHAFNQPEELFSAYEQAIEINEDLEGFTWDELRNVWVKVLNMELTPVTYIYLTQVILRHNNNKITGVEGNCDFSGIARTTNVNTGRAGDDAVTLYYNTRFKQNCDMDGESVDIAGGRLLTFGIPGLTPRNFRTQADEPELRRQLQGKGRNNLAISLQFNNGADSTFVFDVTDQVHRRFRGGIITVMLDMDTIPIPSKTGGSGFNAEVEPYKEETHEIDM